MIKTCVGLAIAAIIVCFEWDETERGVKSLLGTKVVPPSQIIKLTASGVPWRNYVELVISQNDVINTRQSWEGPIPNTQAMGVMAYLLAVREADILIPIKAKEKENSDRFVGYLTVLPEDAKNGMLAYERNTGQHLKIFPYLLDTTLSISAFHLFMLLILKFFGLLGVGWVIVRSLQSKSEETPQ
jgi:hypothetical protein